MYSKEKKDIEKKAFSSLDIIESVDAYEFKQGGYNVHLVVELFLRTIHFTNYTIFHDPLDDFIPLPLEVSNNG